MSLLFYGVLILGVMLGGLVLLVIFSLLAKAQKGDESLEKWESEMLQTQECGPLPSTLPTAVVFGTSLLR